MVSVCVEKQIRWLGHEHSVMSERHARREIQPRHEIFELVGYAITIRVFADGDFVRTFRPARRRLRHAIVFRAEILIHIRRFKPGGIWILEILHDPDASARIETHRDGLTNVRFARDELHFETICHAHLAHGQGGRRNLASDWSSRRDQHCREEDQCVSYAVVHVLFVAKRECHVNHANRVLQH